MSPGLLAMSAVAARIAASALWKATCRSKWLAAIRCCMIVPRTAAKPTSVITTSNSSATTRATPRCAARRGMGRWQDERMVVAVGMSIHPVAYGGGGGEIALQGLGIGAGVLVGALQPQAHLHGIDLRPVAHAAGSHEAGIARLVVGDAHVGHPAYHFLGGRRGHSGVVGQADAIQRPALVRVVAHVPVGRTQ